MNRKKPAKNNLFDDLIAEAIQEAANNPVECVCVDAPEEVDAATAAEIEAMMDMEPATENIMSSPDISDEDIIEEPAQRKRINTTKIFDNTGYFDGGTSSEEHHLNNYNIAIAPSISDRYDYAVTEDIVLQEDRKATADLIYDIYYSAPFASFYKDKETGIIKIPKDDIQRVFYYIKDRLLKKKRISAFETVLAINEFFEFDYNYVYKKVLSDKMKSEILNDYYINMGMKDRMEEEICNPLF